MPTTKLAPVHPGEVVLEEFLEPMQLSQPVPACQGHQRPASKDQRDRPRQAGRQRRHGPATRALLRHDSALVAGSRGRWTVPDPASPRHSRSGRSGRPTPILAAVRQFVASYVACCSRKSLTTCASSCGWLWWGTWPAPSNV